MSDTNNDSPEATPPFPDENQSSPDTVSSALPDGPSADAKDSPPLASTGSRGVAFILDLIVGVGGALLLTNLLGFLIPVDSSIMLVRILLPPLIAFAYLIASPCLCANSFGKYVLRICIRDSSTLQKPSATQCVLRGILLAIWPIEVVVMSASKSRQRLGDKLAKTLVFNNSENRHPGLLRACVAVAAIVALFVAGHYINGYTVKNTAFYRTAQEYIEKQRPGEAEYGSPLQLGSIPRHVAMLYPVSARIVMPATWPDKSGFLAVNLVYRDESWVVQNSQVLDQGGSTGYSYQYSLMSLPFVRKPVQKRVENLLVNRRQQDPAYQAAKAHIEADADIQQRIGTIQRIVMRSGNRSEKADGTGIARYSLILHGERGNIQVDVNLGKDQDTPWNVKEFVIQEEETP
jgi:uncharacterized RDD family membrane protein YckC